VQAMQKKEYTILGATVNIAARVEALTKFFSVDCLISETTVKQLKTDFMLKEMPLQPLRGISSSIRTSWLLPMNESASF
jgi:adenylate cyclase